MVQVLAEPERGRALVWRDLRAACIYFCSCQPHLAPDCRLAVLTVNPARRFDNICVPERLAAIGRLIEQAPLRLPDFVLLQVGFLQGLRRCCTVGGLRYCHSVTKQCRRPRLAPKLLKVISGSLQEMTHAFYLRFAGMPWWQAYHASPMPPVPPLGSHYFTTVLWRKDSLAAAQCHPPHPFKQTSMGEWSVGRVAGRFSHVLVAWRASQALRIVGTAECCACRLHNNCAWAWIWQPVC